jgi:malate dehydrogenase
MPKISIIGAGNIGKQTLAAILKLFPKDQPYEVLFFNRNANKAEGQFKDVVSWLDYRKNPQAKITLSSDIQNIANSDIVICTVGVSSSTIKSSTREEALPFVWKMVNELGDNIKKFAPKALILTVTNPVDVVTQALQDRTGFRSNMVLGLSTEIDARRFRRLFKNELEKLGIKTDQIEAMVIGGHSGQEMILVENSIVVNGTNFSELAQKYKIDQKLLGAAKQNAIDAMRKEGFEIVRLSGHGASSEPALLLALMARAYTFEGFSVKMTATHLVENIDPIIGRCVSLPVEIEKENVRTVSQEFTSVLSESESKQLSITAENHEKLFKEMNKVPPTLLQKIEQAHQLLELQRNKLSEKMKFYSMAEAEVENTTNKLLFVCNPQGLRHFDIILKDTTISLQEQKKLLNRIETKFDNSDDLQFLKDEKEKKMTLRVEANNKNKKTLENIGLIANNKIPSKL